MIHIRKLKSPLLPLNLVGGNCRTSAPVVLPLRYSGPLDLVNGLHLHGDHDDPAAHRLRACHAAPDALMAGPNNPFSVGISPPPAA